MRKRYALIAAVLLSSAAWSQDAADLSAVHKIKHEGLENSQVEEIAFHLTDASGPRLTNSPGYQRAAEWAVGQLTEWGLKNAQLEKWGEFGKGWQTEKYYAAMTEPYYFPLIGAPKAWTSGTNGPISGEVVLMNATTEEDLAQYKGKLAGKIVLVKSTAETAPTFEPDGTRLTEEELLEKGKQPIGHSSRYTPEFIAQYRARRALQQKIGAFLQEENAALIIRGTRGKHGTFFTSNGASYQGDAEPALAEIEMAPEHADLMARLLEHDQPVKLEADVQTRFFDQDLGAYNVVAEIPGTDKNLKSELVMLGGHLDSWHAGTGATDNAAGCIVMMEAVRILQQSGLRPRRTIRIALWSGEEQGIYGSRNYVKNHFADQATMQLKPDHSKLSAYYNIDNGTGRIRGIYLQGNDAVRPIFEAWFAPFKDMIDHPTVTIQNTGGTDHLGFDAVGLPGFQFIQDPIEYGTRTHHTNMDVYERLVKEDLQQMAVIVASMVYHTAQRDEKLPREPLPQPEKSMFE
ncbi:Zn-dependent amino-or carboxypeptidase, M28 family [Catalinimonas alkaloidigena]|uniref:Carboxypeptidase Q n=1 Tax=Catalinimonas alkaloidigena TaxID=1075417 RepID=A0A1G9SIF4_9BACT|nr:M20/M25/M40 family metallo-hydrolase [Catalinimonas alkaloidigena]SDM35209.1 Zn-dependent amino-or carboxypeptidase, M28 family [Catalinimonas alkaloidigena]